MPCRWRRCPVGTRPVLARAGWRPGGWRNMRRGCWAMTSACWPTTPAARCHHWNSATTRNWGRAGHLQCRRCAWRAGPRIRRSRRRLPGALNRCPWRWPNALDRPPWCWAGDGRPFAPHRLVHRGAQGYFEAAIAAGADAYPDRRVVRTPGPPGARDRRGLSRCGHHATGAPRDEALGNHLASEFGLEHVFIDLPTRREPLPWHVPAGEGRVPHANPGARRRLAPMSTHLALKSVQPLADHGRRPGRHRPRIIVKAAWRASAPS